jgi:cell division transport system permease protein
MSQAAEKLSEKNSSSDSATKSSLPQQSFRLDRETSSLGFHFDTAIKSIANAPFTFGATVFTGVITYTILVLSLVLFSQINKAIQIQGQGVSLRLYLKDTVSEADGRIFHSDIATDERILSSKYVTKAEAMVVFKEMLGEDAEVLTGLGNESPLPASVEIRFKDNINSADVFREYEREYSGDGKIERIEYSKSFVGYLTQLQNFISRVGLLMFLVMVTITGMVIANAARLGLYAHREEIQIMKLLGAKDWFVRAPYLIEGAIQGALSGLIGLALGLVLYLIVTPILLRSELISIYLKSMEFLTLRDVVLVFSVAVLIGVMSSLFGTRRVQND